MTRGVTIQEILHKINGMYNLDQCDANLVLSLTTFKRIMMLYPDAGPVMCSDRIVKEKYRDLKDFGILDESGRIQLEAFREALI